MEKLLEVKRGEITEREHYGYMLLCDASKILYKNFEDVNRHFYLRSCAKPMQSSVFQDLGVFEKFDFTPAEIAVVSASHTGAKGHLETIRGIFEKIGLDENIMKCGAHAPIDKESRYELVRNNQESLLIHNNCSGKHVGFLAACVAMGWDIDSYLEFNHPLQVMIKDKIGEYCSYDSEYLSQDGCDAPIMAMPMPNMCYGFSKVFSQNPRIADAFAKCPELIGGKGRIDTEIIRASKGKLLAKVGAEGLCMVYNTNNEQVFAIKIIDSNEQARAIALTEALMQLGWISESEVSGSPLSELNKRDIISFGNTHVGEIGIAFEINV